MNDLISIVVPIYNSESTLERCIDSILRQDYQNFELILIDDGSKDNSLKICNQYIDQRIRIVHQENKGVSFTRNKGISLAYGKYIFFIDSDDYIEKNYFSSFIDLVEEVTDLVLCPIEGFSEISFKCDDNLLIDFNKLDKMKFLELNEKYILYGPVAKMYNLDLIKKQKIIFPIDISFGEDLIFNFNYLKHINKIKYTNKTSYYYDRSNVTSLSQKYRENRYENELILFNVLMNFFYDKGIINQESNKYLYGRIFDSAYNSIAEICKFENKLICQINMISKILKDKTLKKSYIYLPKNKYPNIVVKMMRNELSVMLCFFYKANFIKNKIKKGD